MKVEHTTRRPALDPRFRVNIASCSLSESQIGWSIWTSNGSSIKFRAVFHEFDIVIVGIKVHRHLAVVN